MVWLALTLGYTGIANAGCYFGHATQSGLANRSLDAHGYARNFRILGQWIYEGGQIKYVAWQVEGQCHGPNCSAKPNSPVEQSGVSLPSPTRTQTVSAIPCLPSLVDLQGLCDRISFDDANVRAGYPTAYEYPP